MPSDTLTNDAIAGMLADTHARSYIVNGVRTTTLTTECLEMVLAELLRLRADRDAALEREMQAVKGRDAVVAEAVRVERERCADIAAWHGGHAGNPAVWKYGDVIADAIRRGE